METTVNKILCFVLGLVFYHLGKKIVNGERLTKLEMFGLGAGIAALAVIF
jgi:hypothetical protein